MPSQPPGGAGPGQARIIIAVKSFGSGLKPHIHFHILVTDGVYFSDGSYFALGFWDQPSLLSELRHSTLKSLVARKCLQPETTKASNPGLWTAPDSLPLWATPSASRPTDLDCSEF